LHFFLLPIFLILGGKKGLAVGNVFQGNRPAWKGLTWALMGENGCPVECERVRNSKALGGILLKKIPENQNVI
jgi:hypothetical protein